MIKRLFLATFILVLTSVACSAGAGGAPGKGRPVFDYDFGNGRTVIANRITGELLEGAGPDFVVRFMDGTAVSSGDFESRRTETGESHLKYYYSRDGLEISTTYSWDSDERKGYKNVTVCSERRVAVDSITVLKMSGVEGAYHGGFGEPAFAGDFFVGLEYPAGYNTVDGDTVELKHYPGRTLEDDCLESKTAVVGFSMPGGIEEAFKDYVDTIRYSTSSNLHYNSWYDIREEGMSVAAFEEVFNGFAEGLEKYGLGLDYIVVDDGWQDRDSIWETSDTTFPEGFKPLREILEARGTRLGLWLPYSGTNLDVEWGRKNGYEVNDKGRFYCVAGDKYHGSLKERLKQLIEVDGVRMFKHDFNEFRCFTDRVDYPQTERHSIEANVDAEIELMDYTHGLQPDLFLNVTSSMWLSPWWLMHADTIWMGSSDYGWDTGSASLHKRDWAMTYRDGWLYRRLVGEGHRFPMNAIMTHGIIDGVRNRLGGKDEGWRTWADNVVLYFGRGVYMRELYISPQLMDDRKWKFLAGAAKWAKAMDPVFARTEWVGGDPRKGEAYGYHHYGGGQDWYVVRNPGIYPRGIDIPVDEGKIFRQLYPFRAVFSGGRIELPGNGLVVMKVVDEPGPAGSERQKMEPYVFRKYFSVENTKGCDIEAGSYVCRTKLDGGLAGKGAVLYAALFSDETSLLDRAIINGRELEKSEGGEGWRLFAVPVDSLAGGGGGAASPEIDVAVKLTYDSYLKAPFAAPACEFAFLAEVPGMPVPVDAAPLPGDSGAVYPPVRDDTIMDFDASALYPLDFSSTLLPDPAGIGPDDLEKITAAKLKIKLFGSRGGELKTIMLNNALVGAVPNNEFPFDLWEEFVIDIPQHRLGAIRTVNKFIINDMSEDDGFKFRDIQLAVKLEDGTWRNTNLFTRTQSSSADWEYTEGPVFNGRSRPVKLEFGDGAD